ncbi:MAG: glutathione S-transferase family protein [Hyphomicrobium sp.]
MTAACYRLVIGNKTWSSWSLRPWLVMKRYGLPFEEIEVRLRTPESKANILAHSAAGKVPALHNGDLLIWDSLAIIEYLADRHPDMPIWPRDPAARAIARAVSAEMHSGFQALREHCPMDFLATKPKDDLIEPVETNIRRIIELWRDCRQRFGGDGPYLFSEFSAADAMYAPVASRFRTYIPDLARYGDDGTAGRYVSTLFALPEMAEWAEGARLEQAA